MSAAAVEDKESSVAAAVDAAATEEVNATTSITKIELAEGQSYAEFLRKAAEEGKYRIVKAEADAIVAEVLQCAAKQGLYTYSMTRSKAIDTDVIDYLMSHGLQVKTTGHFSVFGGYYTYEISYAVPVPAPVIAEPVVATNEPVAADDSDVLIKHRALPSKPAAATTVVLSVEGSATTVATGADLGLDVYVSADDE